MNKCKQLLCLLLVVSSLFSLFSVNVHALDNENLIDSNLSNWGQYETGLGGVNKATITYLGNNTNYFYASGSTAPIFIFDLTDYLKIGESYKLSFTLPNTDGVNNNTLNTAKLIWYITDGDETPTINAETKKLIEINKSNKSNYLGKETVYEFTYTEGFQNSFLCLTLEPFESGSSYGYVQMYISNLKLERVQSEEEGLLNSIIEWLKNLKETVLGGFSAISSNLTDGFNNLKNGLIELKNNILELPSKIGNAIKDLFVPDDDYFNEKGQELNDACEEHLGAVFTVSQLLDDFFLSFNTDTIQNEIDVPLLTVDLLGYPFQFGGWSVPIVPDSRLQFMVDASKFVIGVLVTFAFIHGLRKKYDEIFGGGDE